MSISKTTYSRPGLWSPDTDNNVTSAGGPAKQLMTGGKEVTSLKLVSGSGSAHVDIYDWKDDGSHNPPLNAKLWILDCSTTTNDVQTFASPLYFVNIFAVLTEGTGSNPQLCFSVIPSNV